MERVKIDNPSHCGLGECARPHVTCNNCIYEAIPKSRALDPKIVYENARRAERYAKMYKNHKSPYERKTKKHGK